MENEQIVNALENDKSVNVSKDFLTINEDVIFDQFFMDEHEIIVLNLEKIDPEFGDSLLYVKETMDENGDFILEELSDAEMEKALRVKDTLQQIFEGENKNA